MKTTVDIIDTVARDARLRNRRVWCRECGTTTVVANGLRHGWPKCCGYTMTIDPPETWKTRFAPVIDRMPK